MYLNQNEESEQPERLALYFTPEQLKEIIEALDLLQDKNIKTLKVTIDTRGDQMPFVQKYKVISDIKLYIQKRMREREERWGFVRRSVIFTNIRTFILALAVLTAVFIVSAILIAAYGQPPTETRWEDGSVGENKTNMLQKYMPF
jgi:hypothetical protein